MKIFSILKTAAYSPLLFSTFFLLFWFKFYFSSNPIPSVDLPSFIYITELLRVHLLKGNISFYDPNNFCGWSPFLLYGVIPSFFVAIFSFSLDLVTNESVRLATHISLALGVSFLPLSVFYAALPFAREILKKSSLSNLNIFLLGLATSVLTFWFINHDRQWYGIGAAAVMNIGLFTQLFAWHFFLIYLGCLARIVSDDTKKEPIIIVFSLAGLITSHLNTTAYALFIGAICFLWYRDFRKKIFIAHLLGFGVAAFWFIPFIVYVGDIAPLDIYRPKGDFLELFFRYPLWGVLQTSKSWLIGEFSTLNPTNFLVTLLIIFTLSHRDIPRGGLIHTFFLFTICALVFFNSGFIATSFQLGFHFYRFNAYVFLTMVVLLGAVAVILGNSFKVRQEKLDLRFSLAVFLLISCFVITALLPHYERTPIKEKANKNYLKDQQKVLNYFDSLQDKGRVYIEHLTDYKRFPMLSVHYMASRMFKETGFEVVTNSHLQEAPSYRMIAASAKQLGAKTYNVPLLYVEDSEVSNTTLVEQLKDFGITHIVAGRLRFYEKIAPFAISKTIRIGKYFIVQIQETPLRRVMPVQKRLIAYIDLKKIFLSSSCSITFIQEKSCLIIMN